MKENNKDSKNIQKRPDPVLYAIAEIALNIGNRLRFNLHVKGDRIKGPAVILSNHASNHDYKFIVSAASPCRVSFLCTYHFFTFRKLRFWLNRIAAIPKHQFALDLASLAKIRHVLRVGNGIVFIAPEGTVYASGELGYIPASIAKMIKLFKVPVYSCVIRGAGLGNAKWSKKNHRGYTEIESHLLFSPEEMEELNIQQMMERIKERLSFSEFDFQKKKNIIVYGNDKAEGFETMFYKCPSCGKEFTLLTHGNIVECSSCHAKAEFGDDFRFKWEGSVQYYDNYTQWYNSQLDDIRKEISHPDFKMTGKMDLANDFPGVDNYCKIGTGTMTLSWNGWDFEGTREGRPYSLHYDVSEVILATLKVGLHFELPAREGHCQVFYPLDGGNRAMKWHLASRAITEYLEQKNN